MPAVSPSSRGHIDATVFIPTFNGQKYLDQLLTSVESQNFDGNFEILVIDSGSTDKTLEIILAHSLVRLVQIPSEEFGHGKTRNLAASLARGKYIAYLSHDAIPENKLWLMKLLEPFQQTDSQVRAVVGKQIARKNCFPLMKQGIDQVFRDQSSADQISIVYRDYSGPLGPRDYFYSDVNSATIRNFLLNEIPYRDVSYSEDYAFAEDVLNAGYGKAYQPSAVVIHSNDVTVREFAGRMFDETLSARNLGRARNTLSISQSILRFCKDAVISTVKMLSDKDYSLLEKLYWLFPNLVYIAAKWVGVYRAINVDLRNKDRVNKYSLEALSKEQLK